MPIAYSTGLAYRLWGLHDGCNKDTFLLQQRHILALSNHSFMLHPLEGLLVSVQVQLNICNKRIKQLICPNRGYMHLHWLGRSPENWRHRLTVTDFNPSIFHQLGRSPKNWNHKRTHNLLHQSPTYLTEMSSVPSYFHIFFYLSQHQSITWLLHSGKELIYSKFSPHL